MATDGFPVATTPAPGLHGVDWENRVDFDRLRTYRLARVQEQLAASDLGAVLLFETSNIRYATSTHIGYWAFNKGERYALITRTGRPRIWDFGSAAKAHRLQLPQLYDETNAVGGNTGLQGAIAASVGLQERAAQELKSVLAEEGVGDMPLGVDLAETSVFFELQKAGIDVRDGQQVMMLAREIKSADEIMLLTQACAMVDGSIRTSSSSSGRASASPTWSAWPTSACSRWARSSSRRSTRSPANAAARTPTCSPTG